MDRFFYQAEAVLLKGDKDLAAITEKPFPEVQDLLSALQDEGASSAPDEDMFKAIMASAKQKRKIG